MAIYRYEKTVKSKKGKDVVKKETAYMSIVWYVDLDGNKKQKKKSGFKRKVDAENWEYEFKNKCNHSLDMTFKSFYEIYKKNKINLIQQTTWSNKENIINTKIMPYFGTKKMNKINNRDILNWKNCIQGLTDKNGKKYSNTYLRTIDNQLVAIFNYAEKYYSLTPNPCKTEAKMGSKETREIKYWSLEEYKKVKEAAMEKPVFYYALEVLYGTGIRKGEFLALEPKDVDFSKKVLHITKSLATGETGTYTKYPKTHKSYRDVKLPDYLCNELKELLELPNYKMDKNLRLFFMYSRKTILNDLKLFAKKAGVKEINVHGLRHSHVSLLISKNVNATAIAERLGHEAVDITYKYAHLFAEQENGITNVLQNLLDN